MFIWILAHQDDEIMACPFLRMKGRHVLYYLTDGKSKQQMDKWQSRELEIENASDLLFQSFGITVVNFGVHHEIQDSDLYKAWNLKLEEDLVKDILRRSSNEESVTILSTNYEGAHEDHDFSCLIARKIAHRIDSKAFYFSTYPQHRFLPTFHIMRKPSKNPIKFGFKRVPTAIDTLRLLWLYKTQFRTWIGLGPGVLAKYLFCSFYVTSEVEVCGLKRCFYQARGRARQEDIIRSASNLGLV